MPADDVVPPTLVWVIKTPEPPTADACRSPPLPGWVGSVDVIAGEALRTSIARRMPLAQAIFALAPTK
jgi:hypothetical protein